METPAQLVDLNSLTDFMRTFRAGRNWEQFHTPKNVALALGGEVGELQAELQWDTDEQILAKLGSDPTFHRAVSDELADVLIYLVQLADTLAIDLNEATVAKMTANAERYPPAAPAS